MTRLQKYAHSQINASVDKISTWSIYFVGVYVIYSSKTFQFGTDVNVKCSLENSNVSRYMKKNCVSEL